MFFVNLPIALVVIALTIWRKPESGAGHSGEPGPAGFWIAPATLVYPCSNLSIAVGHLSVYWIIRSFSYLQRRAYASRGGEFGRPQTAVCPSLTALSSYEQTFEQYGTDTRITQSIKGVRRVARQDLLGGGLFDILVDLAFPQEAEHRTDRGRGAALGALIGAIAGEGKGAAIGAGAGAGAGTAGAYASAEIVP